MVDGLGDVVLAQLRIDRDGDGGSELCARPVDDRVLAHVQAALAAHDVITAREGAHLVVTGRSGAVMDAIEHAHVVARALLPSARTDITFRPGLPHPVADTAAVEPLGP